MKYLLLVLLTHQLKVVVLEHMVKDLTGGDVMKPLVKYNNQYLSVFVY